MEIHHGLNYVYAGFPVICHWLYKLEFESLLPSLNKYTGSKFLGSAASFLLTINYLISGNDQLIPYFSL